jgi:hypothetical protein
MYLGRLTGRGGGFGAVCVWQLWWQRFALVALVVPLAYLWTYVHTEKSDDQMRNPFRKGFIVSFTAAAARLLRAFADSIFSSVVVAAQGRRAHSRTIALSLRNL